MKNLLLLTTAATFLTGAAWSQDEPANSDLPVQSTNQITVLNRASTFLGLPVKNAAGKPIGKVQDLVIDSEKGRIGYAVLALGNEGKSRSVAIPFSALKADQGTNLVLNMSEPVLAASEGLVEGNWPGVDTFAVGSPGQSQTGTAASSDESDPNPKEPGSAKKE